MQRVLPLATLVKRIDAIGRFFLTTALSKRQQVQKSILAGDCFIYIRVWQNKPKRQRAIQPVTRYIPRSRNTHTSPLAPHVN